MMVPPIRPRGFYFTNYWISDFMVDRSVSQVLYSPADTKLSFLPEGPYSLEAGKFSWVAIQHGAESNVGSINIFDMKSGANSTHELPGRPGFAFPTDQAGVFVAGVEREIGLFNTANNEWTPFVEGIDSGVTNTIINDGLTFDGNLLFGCKDLEFADTKAGLYLWRAADGQLIQLRNDQTCSNGKAIVHDNGRTRLIDIDTPTKQVVSYELEPEKGTLVDRQVIVDLTAEERFPDGMILTPDGKSLIIAFYNPNDVPHGEAVQYSIATGAPEHIWECPGAPQVTCPQLVEHNGGVKLILTTAVEHMTAERQANYPDLGSLFVADTPFSSIGEQPVFPVPAW